MKHLFITLLLGVSVLSFGQKAVKHYKQQTTFFYTQLNLHGGYINDINGSRWDVANRSPNNQIAFQLFSKNKKVLQKGYVKNFALVSYKVRFSVPFQKTVNTLGVKEANFKIQALDTWVKFNTKWDRTSFWIGNKSIPYGHNPKLDPVSSFMTNIIKMDIGFAQDIGIFFKTPLSSKLDLEWALTSGGALNQPLMVCDNLLANPNDPDAKPQFTFADYKYENTWLMTSRIGTPTYKRNEVGLIVLAGKIRSTFIPDDLNNVIRFGGDWVFKYHEKFKLSSQLTLGNTYSYKADVFTSVNGQATADIFLKYRFFVSTSFAINHHQSRLSHSYRSNYTNANSLTYTFSPHTRIRLNHYYSYIKDNDERQWGVLLQFVTGFGKRS